MSFSSEVKREIVNITTLEDCCKKALAYGMMQATSRLLLTSDGMKVIVKSFQQDLIKCLIPILKKNFANLILQMSYQDEAIIQKKRYYYLEITGDGVKQLVDEFHLIPFSKTNLSDILIHKECCKSSFLRGLFIAKGSINDPRKNSYHLEITLDSQGIANLAQDILLKHDISAKVLEKKDNYVLYVKKSEDISKTLAFIGANSGVFYFEDSRIRRDVSNMANRMANCDIANLKKTSETAYLQCQAIEKIRKSGTFDKMSIRLQTMAALREEYPDCSFEELSEYSDKMFGHTMSKSGISHCMKDLLDYARLLDVPSEKSQK
jgi:DNA-binding protein WhiA